MLQTVLNSILQVVNHCKKYLVFDIFDLVSFFGLVVKVTKIVQLEIIVSKFWALNLNPIWSIVDTNKKNIKNGAVLSQNLRV